jgi:aspartyl-tRNA(Asn)/glutamyl-tRNA(Gln) amidotransferase subunit A
VKRRIILGTFVLSSGYYDAYYGSAQKARNLITKKMQNILDEYDFMLTPTSPGTAFSIGIKRDNPVQMYLEDIFTVMANISGMPSLSVPTGLHSNGLPFGIQFTGRYFGELDLLRISQQLKS